MRLVCFAALVLSLVLAHGAKKQKSRPSFRECEALYRNLPDDMKQWQMGRTDYPTGRGQIVDYMGLKYSVLNYASSHPAIEELATILTDPRNASTDDPTGRNLKSRLDAWAAKYGIPFEFVFPADLAGLGNSFDPLNGIIETPVFKKSVIDGKWPIFEPHDLINHVPDLADPPFVEQITRHASVVLRALNRGPKGHWVANYLQKTVRSVTYEGNIFLYRPTPSSKPRLVLHGNAGINLFKALTKNDVRAKEEAVERLQGTIGGTVGSNPSGWLNFPTYLAKRGRALYERHQQDMDRLGATKNTVEDVRERLSKIVDRAVSRNPLPTKKEYDEYDYSKPANFEKNEKRLDAIMDAITEAIADDPVLSAAFNRENRLAALRSSVDLAEDYLSWAFPNRRG